VLLGSAAKTVHRCLLLIPAFAQVCQRHRVGRQLRTAVPSFCDSARDSAVPRLCTIDSPKGFDPRTKILIGPRWRL
jgi:hypothetical protein